MDGYIVVKDTYNISILCLDYVQDITPVDMRDEYARCIFSNRRSYLFEGDTSHTPIPFHKITQDIGYANAYTEIHTAYQSIHDEISQLESYKRNLESDIKRLNGQYNREVAAMKEYERWYEAVTEFDKNSYDVWCMMKHDMACNFRYLIDEEED